MDTPLRAKLGLWGAERSGLGSLDSSPIDGNLL